MLLVQSIFMRVPIIFLYPPKMLRGNKGDLVLGRVLMTIMMVTVIY